MTFKSRSLLSLCERSTTAAPAQRSAGTVLQRMSALSQTIPDVSDIRHTIVNLAIRGRLTSHHTSRDASDNVDNSAAGVPVGWRELRLAELLAEDTRNGYRGQTR